MTLLSTPPHRHRFRSAAKVLLAATALMLIAPAANAATTYSRTTLSATANGTTVTATTVITASVTTSASLAGICARSASGAHYDFPLTAATLTAAGTTKTASRTLPAGSYTYWACAKVGGVWFNIGATNALTVTSAVPPTTPPPTTTPPTPGTTPSGQAMPVGNLPGWKQVFTDDFVTAVPEGQFPGPYAAKWTQYHGFTDTFGTGTYDRGAISAANGAMDLHLQTKNGKAISAAPSPIVTKAWQGQTYGRFTVRFKSDSLPGYRAAWLLWPDSNNWNQGEIDFPEGGLDSTMWGFNHCVGNPSSNCYYFDTKTPFTGWHTATIEWSPGKLTFIMDGKTGTTTTSVPTTPMHWVLQTETGGNTPAAGVNGHLQIDWVAVYTYSP